MATLSKSDYEEIINRLILLNERSEARIDKTNDMICKMVSTIDKVTNVYTSQLTKLQEVRDELVSQNKKLIKITEDCRKESEYANRRYDTLLEKLFALKQNHSENNINVK